MTEAQLNALFRELCVELGFCLAPGASDAMFDAPPQTPEAFARAVFAAEGKDFDAEPRHWLKQQVQDCIARHMTLSETHP